MSKLRINSCEKFLEADFSSKTHIIISPEVIPPLCHERYLSLFVTSTVFPYNYRMTYIHPALFYENMFSEEFADKLHDLCLFTKNGGKVIFEVSENSTLMVCSFMAMAYVDCANPDNSTHYQYTNVPFPYKRSDSDNYWIWSCYWFDHDKKRFTTPEEVQNFLDHTSLEFPDYDGYKFPVSVLAADQEGVISFCVKHGSSGGFAVIPQNLMYAFRDDNVSFVEIIDDKHDEVIINVLDFPGYIISGSRQKVKLSCSLFGTREYEVNHRYFLQFLVIYYSSRNYEGIGFKLDGKKLVDIKLFDGHELQNLPYDFIFFTQNGDKPANFYDTLKKIMPCLKPDFPSSDEINMMQEIVFANRGIEGRSPVIGHSQYYHEKFNNLKVEFTPSALDNFDNMSWLNDDNSETTKQLIDCLEQFKEDILK